MKPLLFDSEIYRDYTLFKFKNRVTGVTRHYEQFAGKQLDRATLERILREYTIITFNGNNYDLPIVTYALAGATCSQLKAASDWIIIGENKGWQFYDHFNLRRPDWIDHIDLIEVAFGQGSLKLYGGRLHSKKLQDLPIEHTASISPEQREVLITYCENDLDTTGDLADHLKPQLDLRVEMGKMYGLDLRSKSDAQIAEAVIRQEVSTLIGGRVSKPNIPAGTTFRYKAPGFLKFRTEQLQRKLAEIEAADFITDVNGSPIEPPCLDGAVIRIGRSDYRMGIGGLHSSEQTVAHYSDDDTVLMDIDVASFYPFIVLNCGLYPKHLTEAFLTVYRRIVERRIEAKKRKDSVTADALKITINGSFGKLGSKYSVLYAPDLMIQVTVTGQLSLLMLIEAFELNGISVVSANTDGIVLNFARNRLEEARSIIKAWEKATGFSMEETHYKAMFNRDVNNYVAVKTDGGIKGKGAYAKTSISKNPNKEICIEAVKALLSDGTPIAETIVRCRDIRKFVTVRTVRGGAIQITNTNYDDSLTPAKQRDLLLSLGWQVVTPGPVAKMTLTEPGTLGEWSEHPLNVSEAYRAHCGEDEFVYLGKVVRWYVGQGNTGALHYMAANKSGNRNKVPSSDGAVPLMQLPDEFPSDVDYEHYIVEANTILKDIGAR